VTEIQILARDDIKKRGKRMEYIAIPKDILDAMREVLNSYELSEKGQRTIQEWFSDLHDTCVDIDAFCRTAEIIKK
jgi:DNA-binding PadR family transcriptional regulator